MHHPWKARIHQVGAQTITTGGVTLALDTIDYDPNGNCSTGSHNYTAPVNGIYTVTFNVEVSTAASLTGVVAQLRKNAVTITNGSLALANNAGPAVYVSVGKDEISLVAGDVLTIFASTFGANSAAAGLTGIANYLSVHFLSPT